ncbi:MAG: hypothetical protein QW393_04390 [Candidatus Micrarchaeaceae archaeon]
MIKDVNIKGKDLRNALTIIPVPMAVLTFFSIFTNSEGAALLAMVLFGSWVSILFITVGGKKE